MEVTTSFAHWEPRTDNEHQAAILVVMTNRGIE